MAFGKILLWVSGNVVLWSKHLDNTMFGPNVLFDLFVFEFFARAQYATVAAGEKVRPLTAIRGFPYPSNTPTSPVHTNLGLHIIEN